MNSNRLAASINTDLSKAFDLVDHDILSSKLEEYGIRGISLSLIKSYLHNRMQYVNIIKTQNNQTSSFVSNLTKSNQGIPQGSILGPILFAIFMNDLPKSIKAHVVMYADDTSAIVSGATRDEIDLKILNTVQELINWFKQNKLIVNVAKTNIILFKNNYNSETIQSRIEVGGKEVYFVDSTKILGLRVDRHLNWNCHHEHLVKKLNTAVYALRRLKSLCDVSTLRTIYFAYFESIMKYGLLFWGNTKWLQTILKIQKKAIRVIAGLKCRDSCRSAFKELKILTAVDLYVLECIIFMHENKSKYKRNNDFHDYGTRQNDIRIQRANINIYNKSFINTSIKLYNKVDKQVQDIQNLHKFKKELKSILLTHTHYTISEFMDG